MGTRGSSSTPLGMGEWRRNWVIRNDNVELRAWIWSWAISWAHWQAAAGTSEGYDRLILDLARERKWRLEPTAVVHMQGLYLDNSNGKVKLEAAASSLTSCLLVSLQCSLLVQFNSFSQKRNNSFQSPSHSITKHIKSMFGAKRK